MVCFVEASQHLLHYKRIRTWTKLEEYKVLVNVILHIFPYNEILTQSHGFSRLLILLHISYSSILPLLLPHYDCMVWPYV